jgi:hypothetical protein
MDHDDTTAATAEPIEPAAPRDPEAGPVGVIIGRGLVIPVPAAGPEPDDRDAPDAPEAP